MAEPRVIIYCEDHLGTDVEWDSLCLVHVSYPKGAVLIGCLDEWLSLRTSAALGGSSRLWSKRWSACARNVHLHELGQATLWDTLYSKGWPRD